MTKSELIQAIAARSEMMRSRAELIVNAIFDAMLESLKRGEGIEIRGFGSFSIRSYKLYPGRNPRTGASVVVQAKRLPFFRMGKDLRQRVQQSHFLKKGTSKENPSP
ncbi:HU family DNA-binding protein [Pajaroellobacter abortibovis]|uniref:Integration host factor n=1 Tax=Pajaroellobacter abortibovis TaxID=1882918 RepID=A0A1L6MW21_9BACT|nr:HU family DNA-binding protein [Pajaroellobacter abortibovis]APR99711.1 integration host factor [Pajaroellobacter abortibovis]